MEALGAFRFPTKFDESPSEERADSGATISEIWARGAVAIPAGGVMRAREKIFTSERNAIKEFHEEYGV
jgi:hypothetical protein